MRLDSLTVELRPRSGWEAMELGSALVRRHAAAIWGPWLLVTLPVLVLLCVGAWSLGYVALAGLAMWWLRPVFDRIPVYVLSRAVFGTAPRTGETVRAQWRWGWHTMLGHLTWRRFSPLRAVMLPIDLLEGTDRLLLSERRRIIGAGASGHAVQLTLMCVNFIIAVQLSLLMLVLLFVPNEKIPEFMEGAMRVLGGRPPEWVVLCLIVADYIAVMVIEPFYIGGGFGLYLNRRTQLEAWDVEIAFRRMRKRIDAGALGVLLLLTACWPLAASAQEGAPPKNTPPTVQSQPRQDQDKQPEEQADKRPGEKADEPMPVAPKTPEEMAEEVLIGPKPKTQQDHTRDDEDGPPPRELASVFGDRTAEHRGFGKAVRQAYEDKDLRPKNRDTIWQRRDRVKREQQLAANPQLDWFASIIAFVGEYGLWLLLGALVLTLLLTAKRWWPWLRSFAMPAQPEPAPIQVQAAEHAEPLPPDIATSARRLWREGQPRRALALLYRASVEAMVARAGTHLPPGATEAECLRVARRMPEAEDRTVFQQVVRVWQYAAYGQRLPEEADFESILQALVQRFGWRT
jgi:Domain of unknown function (DUF4129)